MAAQHATVVVPNVPATLGAVCGAINTFKWFGKVLANAVPLGLAGGVWTPPVPSGNAATLFAWGIWLSQDPGTLLTNLQALATAGKIQLYLWDPGVEDFPTYSARWKTSSGWIDSTAMGSAIPPVVTPVVPVVAAVPS